MPLIPGICTNCGATLSVDQANECMVCPYCDTPFIVEKAVNNFNNTYNITNSTVHIHGGDTESLEKMCARAYQQERVGDVKEAAKSWNEIVKKYPDRYEGWVGMLGHTAFFYGVQKNIYTVYNAISATIKIDKLLQQKLNERFIYMINHRELLDQTNWGFVIEKFPQLCEEGHKKANNLIENADKRKLEILLKKSIREDRLCMGVGFEEHVRRAYQEFHIPIDEADRRRFTEVNPKRMLPCIIGDWYFCEVEGFENPDWVRLDSVIKVINLLTEMEYRKKNKLCIECGSKLGLFGGCPKCKR